MMSAHSVVSWNGLETSLEPLWMTSKCVPYQSLVDSSSDRPKIRDPEKSEKHNIFKISTLLKLFLTCSYDVCALCSGLERSVNTSRPSQINLKVASYQNFVGCSSDRLKIRDPEKSNGFRFFGDHQESQR